MSSKMVEVQMWFVNFRRPSSIMGGSPATKQIMVEGTDIIAASENAQTILFHNDVIINVYEAQKTWIRR